MMTNEFKINECDKCVYVKSNDNDHVIVCLYVDDMLIIGSNSNIIKATKKMLANKFEMKDMSVANAILEIKISKIPQGLVLSQSHYIDKMLNKYKNHGIVIAKTPIDASLHLGKNNGDNIAQLEYSRIIGSLMYIMSCTCPDIAFVVSKLSRYTSNPSQDHWKVIFRILGYSKHTKSYG
ncbi:hypothetical protein IC575_022101 [Cucumis melo]